MPKFANASKGSKVLTDLLSNDILKDNVVKFEEIPQDNFNDFTKASDLDNLKQFRGRLFKDVFNDTRTSKIS